MMTRKIHLWLSIPFGLIITIICLTGAIMVFEPEITRSLQHDIYYVKDASGKRMDAETIKMIVAQSLPDDVEVTDVVVPDNPEMTYQVKLSKPHKASKFVDPYSGTVTGDYSRPELFTKVMQLHRWLLNAPAEKGAMSVGKMVIAITTIAFIVILITGVMLWMKRAKHNFFSSLKIRMSGGWKAFWITLHTSGGIYVVIMLLLMALTGLTWSFGWYREGFNTLFGINGESRVVYNIHSGSFWGITTRIIWFLAAIMGATLPLTGYYIWCIKRKK